ncbi:hypothetical protein ACH4S9_24515 [Streptomyces sp. NPDC021225]|uniref:hypothetical protein n=1 Tax=Streptomyces sp. NPDC021225 TaxID=3365121 RepID=UPI003796FB8F
MFDFGIQDYRPRWMSGPRAVGQVHGARLRTLISRPLTRLWVVWDLEDDEWFPDCPVLLDFDGEQVEINHWKLDELSLTWNAIDPRRPVEWPGFALRWRDDAIPEAAPLLGQPVRNVELLEWTGTDAARGTVDVGFVFPHGRITVYNALDENGLSFAPPHPLSRPHPLG